MIPGLPAHILLMCVRYADALNDAGRLRSLMSSIISGIKQVVKVGTAFDIGPWDFGYFKNIVRIHPWPILHLESSVNHTIPQTSLRPTQGKKAKLFRKDKFGQGSPRLTICK